MLAAALLAAERLFRRKQVRIDPAAVRQILFLEYLVPLGCCVHLTPVFAALKQCRPEVKITVATRGLGVQVLRHSPHVDHLIETPDPLSDLGGATAFLRGRLRELGARPDCVLTGASDQRTRISLLGALATKGWRGGYTLQPALYHRPLEYERSLSLIANNLRLAALLRCDAADFEPRVFFSRQDAETARALVSEINPEAKPLLIIVTQNSGGQRTGWHPERFVKVIRHASEKLGFAVGYVGTSADAAAIEAIRQAVPGVGFSVAGRTSVTELAALLAMSDVIVTLDTGTMHVGRAVQTPMVVLGPSWQKPVEWLPLTSAQVRILRGADRDAVPEGYRLDEISAEAVIAALEEIFRVFPASEEARGGRVRWSLSRMDHRAERQ